MYRIVIVTLFVVFILFHFSSVSAWHQKLGIDNLRASELYRNNPNDPLVKQWQDAMMDYMKTANSCVEDTTGTVFTGPALQGCLTIVGTIVENCKAHPNSLLICEDTRLNEYLNKTINSPKLNEPLLSPSQQQTTEKNFVPESSRNEECSSINESFTLQNILDSKGVFVISDFHPCKFVSGRVTLNIPENDNLKLAVLYIDYSGNSHDGALITPSKIEDLDKNQALFSIELDKTMKGIDPITGKSKTVTKINGLALFNTGDESIVFKPGNTVTVTATLTNKF